MNAKYRLAWLPDRVIEMMRDVVLDTGDDAPSGRMALVKAYQSCAGLDPDGWPGTKTAQALLGALEPVARNRRELARQVGVHEWERTGKGRGIKWTSTRPDVVRVELHTGDYARIHRLFAAEFAAIYRLACVASGYTPDSVQTYNPRVIYGTDKLSMHSYGVAVDFDPDLNPWGSCQKSGEPSPIRENAMFHQVWEWAGWTWGGRWDGNNGDQMHMQRKN